MKRILLFSILALNSILSSAQGFEGVIKFSISYESLPAEMEEAVAMLPKEQTFYIKNSKSKFVQNSSMSNTTVISNSDDKSSIVLMEAMGQKYKMTMTSEEVDKMEQDTMDEIKIEYINETKIIAGYTCKKAVVKMEGMEEEAVFYYTEEIPPLKLSGMDGLHLKGLPLEYIISMEGMKMEMKATSVEKKVVADSTFDIPEGYTEMPDFMREAMNETDN